METTKEIDKEYIKKLIKEELDLFALEQDRRLKEFSLLERIVRVEEELKSQRELFIQRFEAIDKRFEDLISYMDKRFEAVDKRFGDVNKRFDDVNKRFDDVNKRFVQLTWFITFMTALLTTLITIFRFLK